MSAIFAYLSSILRSKTMVFNIVAFVAGLLSLPQLHAIVGPEVAAYLVSIVAFINLVLRHMTSKPLSAK